jgi:putative heme-binding domain-containing protein
MRQQFFSALAVAAVAIGAVGSDAAQDHPGDYAPADIAYGARLYAAQCSTCHGPNGDMVGGIDFHGGKFRSVATDQDITRIVTNGVAGIVAYLRNMNSFDAGSATAGDARRGQGVFEGKGGCVRCHRVDGKGAGNAPDLSDVGASRSAGSLQRSLLDPTGQMMPINRPVRLVTRDGRTINGRRLNEDTYTVQVIDDQERLTSFVKADLREYTILTTSPMPSFRQTLNENELADVVAYLLSLKGR